MKLLAAGIMLAICAVISTADTALPGVYMGMIARSDGKDVMMFSATSGQLMRWISWQDFQEIFIDKTRPEFLMADSGRRNQSRVRAIVPPSLRTAETVTNWQVLPPSPVNIRQVESADVRSNMWVTTGTNRTLISSRKIGVMSRGLRTNYMEFNLEEPHSPSDKRVATKPE